MAHKLDVGALKWAGRWNSTLNGSLTIDYLTVAGVAFGATSQIINKTGNNEYSIYGVNQMTPAIIDIKGIGPAAAETLAEYRINSVTALARASIEKISAIPGFSETRAATVISQAADLLAASGITQSADDSDQPQGKEDKKDKKDKKNKKKKGKDKGKKGKGKNKGKGEKKGKGKKKGKK